MWLADALGMSRSFVGLTVVAAGTSLPELATSAVAAVRKNADIAVGNIVGSNIFNVLCILGVSSLVRPLPFAAGSNLDVGVMLAATVLLFVVARFGPKERFLERWEGALLLGAYAAYLVVLVVRG